MAEPPILELLLPCAGAILSKNVICVDFHCVMQGMSWRLGGHRLAVDGCL